MKLRARLFVSHVGIVTAGATVTAACALLSLHRYVVTADRADLAARTIALSASVTDQLEQGDERRVATVVSRYGAQADIWIRVIAPDGTLKASSSLESDGAIANWKDVSGVEAALAGEVSEGIAPGVGSADDRLFVAAPLIRDGRQLGAIRVSRTLAGLKQQDRATLLAVLVALLGVIAAAATGSRYLSRALAAPITRMRDFAVSIGEGHLGRRVNVDSDDELGELGGALNLMSARLGTLDEERRTFLARASHELRTPVTNVQASLEALEGGAADIPELRRKFLATALLETTRMASLVRQLLDLGELEAGVTGVELRVLDLRRLIEQVVQAMAVRFQTAAVTVEVSLQAVAPAQGDPDRLKQVLLNVLDNALRFSPRDSKVRVSLGSDDGTTVIVVADEGPGFSPEDLPRVFDQFFSSQTSHGSRGAGLGLAIARRITEAHGGELSAANAPTGGAVVTIRLPSTSIEGHHLPPAEGLTVRRITARKLSP
ncbi:MAG: HAMP domain-containing sensor histidine kinase [Myxococcales bacterium]